MLTHFTSSVISSFFPLHACHKNVEFGSFFGLFSLNECVVRLLTYEIVCPEDLGR